MRRIFLDECREQLDDFKSSRLHRFAEFVSRVFAHMPDFRCAVFGRALVQEENLRIVASIQASSRRW